jgi:hypothetical protein
VALLKLVEPVAKLFTKHQNAENVVFSNFSGGLNLVTPPESLADNEMQAANNLEFDPNTGLLKIRGGLSSATTSELLGTSNDIIPLAGGNSYLYSMRNTDGSCKLYYVSLGVSDYIGDVDGDLPISFVYYGEAGDVALVGGGHLHIFHYATKTLQRIVSSECPTKCSCIFYRAGRVAVSETGSDTIRYSAVGDPDWWVNVPDQSDKAQFVDVGYKDGCEVTAVAPMVGEIIIFKCPPGQPEHGRIYRLQGDFPNWSIVLYSQGMAAWNSASVTQVANNLLFLTREGLSSLATATEFGDYKTAWPGAKINSKLANVLTENCRIWHVAIRSQVFIWDGHSNNVYCYHYAVGDGAWTVFQFPDVVRSMASAGGKTMVAIRNVVCSLDDSLTDDNVFNPDTFEIEQYDINALWSPRTIIRNNQILVKKVRCNYLSTIGTAAEVDIEGLRVPLPLNGMGDTAATDAETAALDTDPLVPYRTAVVRTRCNIIKWDVTPRIYVTNGLFSLATLSLELAEV